MPSVSIYNTPKPFSNPSIPTANFKDFIRASAVEGPQYGPRHILILVTETPQAGLPFLGKPRDHHICPTTVSKLTKLQSQSPTVSGLGFLSVSHTLNS